ncbi:MAG: hypothetical protein QY323_04555 [Patescibacteria group bacterium]|nr:MAG: hypothetical protein QY323_04555 [Patescibacteria group bacterium]
MIRKLRDLDESTVLADGPLFDLPKALACALAILRTLMQRAQMRFPDSDPPTYMFASEGVELPFEDESPGYIAWTFEECKFTRYDVAPLYYEVQFGPFMAHLYLLGFDCLVGPTINCQTRFELNWDRLDPTPLMLIMPREGLTEAFEQEELAFLTKHFAGSLPAGVIWNPTETEEDGSALAIHFPHAAFGKGEGTMRIYRILDVSELLQEQEP